MVVVFGYEIQMIYQAHGLLQAGMEQGAGEEGRLEFVHAIEQTESGGAEFGQKFF